MHHYTGVCLCTSIMVLCTPTALHAPMWLVLDTPATIWSCPPLYVGVIAWCTCGTFMHTHQPMLFPLDVMPVPVIAVWCIQAHHIRFVANTYWLHCLLHPHTCVVSHMSTSHTMHRLLTFFQTTNYCCAYVRTGYKNI